MWRRPRLQAVKTVTEAELQTIFLNAPENPLWNGTLAVLDLQVQEELEDSLDDRLSNKRMRSRLGAVAGLLRLKQRLQDYEAEARRTQQEAEEQEAQSKQTS